MKNLVQIIKDNPNAMAVVDNDSWQLFRVDPSENPHDENGSDEEFAAFEAWHEQNELANDSSIESTQDSAGNCYGGDILYALAEIVGLKLESA